MKKRNASAGKSFWTSAGGFTLISIVMGLVIGAIILAFAGYNPFQAYWVMLQGIFGKPKYIAYTIIKATPLIMTGLSVAFAARTGLFNIGAEGQYIIGALTAAMAGIFLHLPPVLHFLVVLILAIAAAGLWGAIAGYLKAKFGVNEVITTIMLNWIAIYLSNFIVLLPGVRREHSEATLKILDSARIDILGSWKISEAGLAWRRAHPFWNDLLKAELNFGFIIAILIAVLIWWILKKTTLGFELRSVGSNKFAAEYGGINVKRSTVISMAIAGGLAGAAGALQVTGVTREVANLYAMEGFGFDGIAVSLIGNSTSIGCVFAGLLFGALKYGGGKIQVVMGAPKEIVNIVIGTIIFFVAMPKLIQRATAWYQDRKKAKALTNTDGGANNAG